MFAKLRIREVLLLGFGVVLLLLLVVTVVGLTKMAAINADLLVIANDRYPKIELVNDSIKSTLNIGRLVRSAVLYNDGAEVEQTIGQIESIRQQNAAYLVEMKSMVRSARGKGLYARIIEARETLAADYAPLYALTRAQRDAEATAFIKTRFAPANNAFMAALEKMADFQVERMNDARKEAAAAYQNALWMMSMVSAAALVLGVAVALLIARRLSAALALTAERAERIADGDLTAGHEAKAAVASRNELITLLGTLEAMRDRLAQAMHTILDNANYVSDSAHQLSSMAEQVAISTQRQAESTTNSAATLEQLTVSINHVADSANDAAQQAGLAGDIARNSDSKVHASISRIENVSHSVQRTAEDMARLTKEVQEIGNIVTVIHDVADQTNLLALNAAIEAARAGEAGRGFAVVADEVRKLAERTARSAQEITQMIGSIQKNADLVVGSMRESSESVSAVTQSAAETGESMRGMQAGTDGVMGAVSTINHALGEQRNASQGLAKDMEQVSQMAEENSATVEELATTSHQLMSLSQTLKGVVEHFRL